MKLVYAIVIVLLTIPVCFYAQTIAPRRPLALNASSVQSTRKGLLQLREKVKEAHQNAQSSNNTGDVHKLNHIAQQK